MILLDKLVQDPVGFVRTDPLGQAVLAPFLVAVVLALVFRLVGGGRVGRRIAAAGVGAGFLVAFVLMLGPPLDMPPANTAQQIFWIAAVGLVLGLIADVGGWVRAGAASLAVLIPAAALIWLVGPRYESLWPIALLLFAASIPVLWRVAAAAQGSEEPGRRSAALFPPILVLAAAAGFTFLAWKDGAGIALLAVALCAATFGFLLIAYLLNLVGMRPLRFDAAGTFGAAGAALALAYVALLGGSKIDPIAIAILLLVFAADIRARDLAFAVASGEGIAARLVQPIVYAIVVAIPALAAVVYSIYAPLYLF
ncbi:MAG: hypothetical protein KIT16_12560 [Rhodospirillaceae bacterium]|nr:hypothetical protein [Rhodospirillaceae bacterium]